VERSLVPFLGTKKALALLVNDPNISVRSKGSFRHLEHQNLSIMSDVIDGGRMDGTMPVLYWITV